MRRLALSVAVIALSSASCGGTDDGATTTTAAPVPTAAGATTTSPGDGAPEPVTFTTSDGLTLEGRRFGSGDHWIVLAHMRPATMESWFAFAEEVAHQGASALAFNFRGYGESEGDQEPFAVDADVLAAVDYARSQGASRVSLIGASMGGTGVIAAAALRPADHVVSLSAPAEFQGTDALAVVGEINAPLLIVAAEADQPYAEHAQSLVDASAGENSQLLLLSGAAHGTDLLASHPELTDRLLDFVGLGG